MPETTDPQVMTTAVRARRAWTRVADRARSAPKTLGHAISDDMFEAEVTAELDALAARSAEYYDAIVAELGERIANMEGELARTKAALRNALSGRTPVMGPLVVGTREHIEARVRGIGPVDQARIVSMREEAIEHLMRYGWTEDRARIIRLANISLEPYTTSADAETP